MTMRGNLAMLGTRSSKCTHEKLRKLQNYMGVTADQHYVIYGIDDNAMGVVYIGAYFMNTIVMISMRDIGGVSIKSISKTQAETVIEFGALSELNLIDSVQHSIKTMSNIDIPVVLLRFAMPEVAWQSVL
jgi:hypothetical protein